MKLGVIEKMIERMSEIMRCDTCDGSVVLIMNCHLQRFAGGLIVVEAVLTVERARRLPEAD